MATYASLCGAPASRCLTHFPVSPRADARRRLGACLTTISLARHTKIDPEVKWLVSLVMPMRRFDDHTTTYDSVTNQWSQKKPEMHARVHGPER